MRKVELNGNSRKCKRVFSGSLSEVSWSWLKDHKLLSKKSNKFYYINISMSIQQRYCRNYYGELIFFKWANNINKQFTVMATWIANKYMMRCLALM